MQLRGFFLNFMLFANKFTKFTRQSCDHRCNMMFRATLYIVLSHSSSDAARILTEIAVTIWPISVPLFMKSKIKVF